MIYKIKSTHYNKKKNVLIKRLNIILENIVNNLNFKKTEIVGEIKDRKYI